MESKIAEIFSVLFNRKIDENSDISMDSEKLWDSMKHIEIITTIEEELGISFEISDIPKMKSMAEIINKAKELV